MTDPPSTIKSLIYATHILHHHAVLDIYGHISIRNPASPTSTFYLARDLAPALISRAEDIIEYKIDDGEPVAGEEAPKGYRERYIHSEIYKRFPAIHAVLHAHSESVLPWTMSGVQLQAVINTAGFLGTTVPVFDIATHYSRTDRPDLLVSSPALGAHLAAAFSDPGSYSAAAALKAGSSLLSSTYSSLTGSASAEVPRELQPDHAVVLMRGHGFTAVGSTLQETVYRAIYTVTNAKAQASALALRDAWLDSQDRNPREEEHPVKGESVHVLSAAEAEASQAVAKGGSERAWGVWCREVECEKLYRCEV